MHARLAVSDALNRHTSYERSRPNTAASVILSALIPRRECDNAKRLQRVEISGASARLVAGARVLARASQIGCRFVFQFV
jgi:hypothetical protein